MKEKEFTTYRVYNIEWDTDDEPYTGPLPTEITFTCLRRDDIEDYISDWLSDKVGFCHYGFDYEEVY